MAMRHVTPSSALIRAETKLGGGRGESEGRDRGREGGREGEKKKKKKKKKKSEICERDVGR
jgi:hypothetical protein